MRMILEMVAPSNPNSTNNSRIQHDFQNPSDINNVIDSHKTFVPKNNIPSPKWKKAMKEKIPLPPKHKSSSLTLAPLSNRRIALDEAIEYEIKHGRKVDPNMDRKQLRRMLSNRLSAQRHAMKTSQYINDMKKMVNDLEGKISVLTSQIEIYKEQLKQLQLQNNSLQRRIEIRSSESMISKMLLEQKLLEISRLKDLRHNQPASLPYSIEFYQSGLRKFELNQFIQEQLHSSAPVQSEPETTPTFRFTAEQPVEVMAGEKSQEEDEIDQYLNFDEINLDPDSILC